MIVEFSILDTDDFSIEHIFDSPENESLIADFCALNGAEGLENYLKNQAAADEKDFNSRTYLVKDKVSGELAAYFSLRGGLITIQAFHESFDTIPAVELSNFAVNKNYRNSHPETAKIGAFILKRFIIPICQALSKYIGLASLYIYALPDEKLIEYYTKLGFPRLPKKQEKFVQNHIKPKYDEGCVFMFQNL